MSDMLLRQNILDELDFEPSVDAAHIGVSVANSVVTLSGIVGSYAEKLAAEKAARRVKGVTAIAEEIKVRYPGDSKTSDTEIAQRAVDILHWNAVVPPDSIQIQVQDGWVALSGKVDWHYQRAAAESAVRKLSGVVGVVNSITVQPRVQADDVKRKIEDALKRNAEVEAERINVIVHDGGHIALDGFIDDWRERQAAEYAAWSAPGVRSVENRLTIS